MIKTILYALLFTVTTVPMDNTRQEQINRLKSPEQPKRPRAPLAKRKDRQTKPTVPAQEESFQAAIAIEESSSDDEMPVPRETNSSQRCLLELLKRAQQVQSNETEHKQPTQRLRPKPRPTKLPSLPAQTDQFLTKPKQSLQKTPPPQ